MKYDYFRILYKTDPYSIMSKKKEMKFELV